MFFDCKKTTVPVLYCIVWCCVVFVVFACCRLDWERILARKVKPPYVPAYSGPNDTSNFDKYPDSDDDSAAPLDSKDREVFKDF